MSKLTRFTVTALGLVAALALASCSKSTNSPVAPAVKGIAEANAASGRSEGWGGGKRGRAQVLFVHASPDAPAVDIYVGGRKVARSLGFPNNTPYRSVRAESSDVRVNVAGTMTTALRGTLPFQAGTSYSLFAINTVANIEPLLLTDDLTRPAAGNAHVRFIHLSPDAPAVDIAVANGGPVVFGNKSFKDYTPFTPLPAGTYDLEVRVAGTNTVALPLPGIKLEAGRIYTVFAKGLLNGTGAQKLGAQIIVNSESREFGRGGRDDDGDDDKDWKRGVR